MLISQLKLWVSKFKSGCLSNSLRSFIYENDLVIDFAVIDAGHSFNSVLSELHLVDKKLKKGDYIFYHDYRENDPEYEETVYAINIFAKKYKYDQLLLNASIRNRSEIVWGACILRKPLKNRPITKLIKYFIILYKLYVLDLIRRIK